MLPLVTPLLPEYSSFVVVVPYVEWIMDDNLCYIHSPLDHMSTTQVSVQAYPLVRLYHVPLVKVYTHARTHLPIFFLSSSYHTMPVLFQHIFLHPLNSILLIQMVHTHYKCNTSHYTHQLIILYFKLSFVEQLPNQKHSCRVSFT